MSNCLNLRLGRKRAQQKIADMQRRKADLAAKIAMLEMEAWLNLNRT